MSEVLVVIDHTDGEVKKPTYELLTIAGRLGEPSAVFFGSADKADAVAEKVKAYGAAKVSVIDDAGLKGYLVAPKAEAMAQRVAQLSQPALPRSRPGGVVAWVVRATDKAGNVTVRRGIRRKG